MMDRTARPVEIPPAGSRRVPHGGNGRTAVHLSHWAGVIAVLFLVVVGLAVDRRSPTDTGAIEQGVDGASFVVRAGGTGAFAADGGDLPLRTEGARIFSAGSGERGIRAFGAGGTRPAPADTGDWFGQERLDDAYLPPSTDADHAQGRNLATPSRHVFLATNETRQSRGLSTLQPEPTLSRIACRHNKDMMAHNYMGHEDSEGRGPSERIAREHRRVLMDASGENVLWNYNPQTQGAELGAQLVDSWMTSPGHRENILKAKYTHLGACVTQKRDTVRATQLFATLAGHLDSPIPWTVTAGDSLEMSATLYRPDVKVDRYSISRVGSDRKLRFRDMHRLEGMIHVPRTTGLSTLHFWAAHLRKQSVHYEGVAGGPYFKIRAP